MSRNRVKYANLAGVSALCLVLFLASCGGGSGGSGGGGGGGAPGGGHALVSRQILTIPGTPRGLAVARMNPSGPLSILTTSVYEGTVQLISVKSGGLLELGKAVPMGEGPVVVRVADFNGDGIPDIVAANLYESDFSVAQGLGGEKFAPAVHHALPMQPEDLVVLDYNHDGKPDIAVIVQNEGFEGEAYIFQNLGLGKFSAPVSLGVTGASSLTLASLTGSGNNDLIVGQRSTTRPGVVHLFGWRASAFERLKSLDIGNPCPPSDPQMPASCGLSVAAGDLNGDGKADLVISEIEATEATVFLGDGANYKSNGKVSVPFSSRHLALSDVDGDRRLDLIGMATGEPFQPEAGITVAKGQGNGTFGSPVELTSGWRPYDVIAEDMDGDGAIDLASVDTVSDTISLVSGTGKGKFDDGLTFTNSENLTFASNLISGGKPGLLTLIKGEAKGEIHISRTDGEVAYTTSASPSWAGIVDVNLDGVDDVLVKDGAKSLVSVFLGNARGGLSFIQSIKIDCEDFLVAGGASNLIGVACPGREGAKAQVFQYKADGVKLVASMDLEGNPVSLAIGDIDRNGTAEIWISFRETFPDPSAPPPPQSDPALLKGFEFDGKALHEKWNLSIGRGTVTALQAMPSAAGGSPILWAATDGGFMKSPGTLFKVALAGGGMVSTKIVDVGKTPSSIRSMGGARLAVTNAMGNTVTLVNLNGTNAHAQNFGTVSGPQAVATLYDSSLVVVGSGWPHLEKFAARRHMIKWDEIK